mgnify:CR=1 FL=1
MKHTARINYDAIPSKGFKYMVEINNIDCEAVDYISVNNDDDNTIQKELLNFNKLNN